MSYTLHPGQYTTLKACILPEAGVAGQRVSVGAVLGCQKIVSSVFGLVDWLCTCPLWAWLFGSVGRGVVCVSVG